jgi:glycosyltransferase involved in cell wall biosynthesis
VKSFIVATPYRSVCDEQARALHAQGQLRLYTTWTRRGTDEISPDLTRKLPLLGLASYIGAKTLPPYQAEAFRFSLYPLYDRWVASMVRPGDSIISSYCYANESFRKVRALGGKTFLDAGNSHPDNFWKILSEEHSRWNCPYPPVPRFYIRRARAMLDETDYIIAPSEFVAESFLERGFDAERILRVPYGVDLSTFTSNLIPREKSRPFTLISTGSLSLRKGTPYLLEAFRMIRKTIPDARLLLSDLKSASILPILESYSDLPIEWAPSLGHEDLARRLKSADLFILPSLEEGLVRTALEAMACGVPVILTPNTGSSDYVTEGVNGSVVPIRDAAAIAEKAIWWWRRINSGENIGSPKMTESILSPDQVRKVFLERITALIPI